MWTSWWSSSSSRTCPRSSWSIQHGGFVITVASSCSARRCVDLRLHHVLSFIWVTIVVVRTTTPRVLRRDGDVPLDIGGCLPRSYQVSGLDPFGGTTPRALTTSGTGVRLEGVAGQSRHTGGGRGEAVAEGAQQAVENGEHEVSPSVVGARGEM